MVTLEASTIMNELDVIQFFQSNWKMGIEKWAKTQTDYNSGSQSESYTAEKQALDT